MNTTSVNTAPLMAPRFDGRLLFESNNLDIVHLTLKTGDAIAPHSNPVDVVFFVVNTIAVMVGVYLFISKGEAQWIPVLVIEYAWALDNMRHNRP